MKPEELNALAVEAMGHAYAPYSGYQVGAALLCKDGTVYQGCNIENASFSPTVCAERTAIFKAVYDGHRDFAALSVCGGKGGVITGAFPPAACAVRSCGNFAGMISRCTWWVRTEAMKPFLWQSCCPIASLLPAIWAAETPDNDAAGIVPIRYCPTTR